MIRFVIPPRKSAHLSAELCEKYFTQINAERKTLSLAEKNKTKTMEDKKNDNSPKVIGIGGIGIGFAEVFSLSQDAQM